MGWSREEGREAPSAPPPDNKGVSASAHARLALRDTPSLRRRFAASSLRRVGNRKNVSRNDASGLKGRGAVERRGSLVSKFEGLQEGRLLPWVGLSLVGVAALWAVGMTAVSALARILFLPDWTVTLAGLGTLVLGLPAAVAFAVLRAKAAKRKRQHDVENENPAEGRIRALEEERDFYRALVDGRGLQPHDIQAGQEEPTRGGARRRHSG